MIGVTVSGEPGTVFALVGAAVMPGLGVPLVSEMLSEVSA